MCNNKETETETKVGRSVGLTGGALRGLVAERDVVEQHLAARLSPPFSELLFVPSRLLFVLVGFVVVVGVEQERRNRVTGFGSSCLITKRVDETCTKHSAAALRDTIVTALRSIPTFARLIFFCFVLRTDKNEFKCK